jgi:hypothetical protein
VLLLVLCHLSFPSHFPIPRKGNSPRSDDVANEVRILYAPKTKLGPIQARGFIRVLTLYTLLSSMLSTSHIAMRSSSSSNSHCPPTLSQDKIAKPIAEKISFSSHLPGLIILLSWKFQRACIMVLFSTYGYQGLASPRYRAPQFSPAGCASPSCVSVHSLQFEVVCAVETET